LSGQLKDKASVVAGVAKERDTLSAQLKASQAESAKLADNLAQAQAALKAAQDKMPEQLASVRLPLESKVSAAQEQLKQSQADAQAKASELAKLNDQYRAIQSELSGVSQAKASTEKELASAKESLKALNVSLPQQVKAAQEPLEAMIVKLKAQLKDLDASIPEKIVQARKPLEEKLAQLSAQSEGLSGQLKDKASVVAGVAKERDALSAKLAALQDQSALLSKELKDTQEKASAVESLKTAALAEAERKNETLLKNVNNLVADKEALAREVASLRATLNTHETSFPEKLAQAQQPLQQKIDLLQKTSADYSAKLQDNDTELARVKGEKMVLTASLENEKKVRLALEAKVAAVQGQMEKTNNDIDARVAKVRDPLEKRVKDLENQLKASEILAASKIKQTVVPLNDRISFLENEVKTAQGLYQQQEQLVKDLIAKRDDLSRGLSEAENERKSLKVQVTTLNAKVTDFEDGLPVKLAQAKAPVETKLAEIQSQAGRLNAALADKDGQIVELNGQLALLKQSVDQSGTEKGALKNQLVQLKEQVKAGSLALDERVKLTTELKAKNADLTTRLSALEQAKGSVDKRYAETSAELKSFQDSIKSRIEEARQPLEDTLLSLQKNLADKDVALKDRDVQIMRLSGERNDFVQKLSREEELRKSVEGKMVVLDMQNKDLSVNLTRKLEDARVPLQKQIDGLKADLASAKADALKMMESMKSSYEEKIRGFNAQLQAGADEKDSIVAQARAAADRAAQEKMAALRKALEAKEAQLKQNDLSLSLASLKAEELVKDADMLRQDKLAAEQELIQAKEKINGELMLLKSQKSALEARFQETAGQLSSVQASQDERMGEARQSLEAKLSLLQEQMTGVNRQLAARDAQVKELQASAAALSSQKDGAMASLGALKAKVMELEETLRQKDAALKVSTQKTEAKANDLRAVKDELQGAMELIK
ncbi:MAG: hypothetical protein V2A70_07070, partial [Candidatus Omnitrophota bacterium]